MLCKLKHVTGQPDETVHSQLRACTTIQPVNPASAEFLLAISSAMAPATAQSQSGRLARGVAFIALQQLLCRVLPFVLHVSAKSRLSPAVASVRTLRQHFYLLLRF